MNQQLKQSLSSIETLRIAARFKEMQEDARLQLSQLEEQLYDFELALYHDSFVDPTVGESKQAAWDALRDSVESMAGNVRFVEAMLAGLWEGR